MKASILLVTLILAAAVLGLAVSASITHGAASMQAGPAAAGRWETIYEEPGVALSMPGERFLIADAGGSLHAVYGGMGLYYARQVDGQWQHELVDGGFLVGSLAALTLDARGWVHVCYVAGAPAEPAELRYAWRDDRWHIQRVTSLQEGWPCSIAVNAYNEPAIAYRAGNDVALTSREATGWHTEVLAAGVVPGSISLAIGSPYDTEGAEVAYTGSGLHYLHRDAAGWHNEKLAEVAYNASLAKDHNGTKIAYTVGDALVFTRRVNETWLPEIVTTGEAIYTASLALKDGMPYIAYHQGYSPAHLMHAYYDISGWHTVDMGAAAEAMGSNLNMVVAGQTRVAGQCQSCAGYLYGPTAHLDATRLTTLGNVTETVAATRYVGATQKLAVAADGKAHLVYSDGTGGEPIYVYEDAEGWHRERVAGAAETDAMALDKAGRPHLAFANGAGLHYGLREGGWRFELVRPAGASDPALSLDAQDQPVLAWQESGGLKVGSKAGGQWQMQLVQAGQARAPVLALDPAGAPQVGYTDPAGLRHAYPYGGRWYRSYPAPLLEVHDALSLVVDQQRTAYLGYDAYSEPGGNPYNLLKVAVRSGREWRTTELATCDYFPCPISLADSPSGGVSAAYVVGFPFVVSYAWWTGGTWQAETVASVQIDPVNWQLSVSHSLDGEGRPTVSYYSPDILGIRVARWVAGGVTPTPTATVTASGTKTPTPTAMPRATQTPSLACLTPTPAAPYTGIPPASGTIQKPVVHCADDAYVRVDTDEILYDFTYVRMGARDGGSIPYVAAFLFRDVRIPRGADITSAKLRLQPEGHYSGTSAAVSIAGELHGQSGDFNPNNWWPHLRPRTVARVPWTAVVSVTAAADTPDISAIVEEIVALPDWKPGNNIAIFLDPTDTTNAWVNWYAYDGKPSAAAQLSVTYQ